MEIRSALEDALDDVWNAVPREKVQKNAFRITFLYFSIFMILVLTFGSFKSAAPSDPQVAPFATAWATEIATADPGHPLTFIEEQPRDAPPEPNIQQPACPQGGLVPHPCREPDNLRIVRISRYDPSLGGVNCFRWGNGTCLSSLANGERWEHQFEQVAACAPEWPFGTIFEIGDHRWVCKDRGGKIVQYPAGVYWVDLLSKNVGAYGLAFGDVITVSVWWPE